MSAIDIQERAVNEATRNAETNHRPEAVSVLVDLTPVGGVGGEVVAHQVAPMVAKRLWPERSFGEALHVEQVGPMLFEVAVAVNAPSLANVVFGRMPAGVR